MSLDPISIIVVGSAALGAAVQGSPVPPPVAEVSEQVVHVVQDSVPQMQAFADEHVSPEQQQIIDQAVAGIADVAPRIEQALPPQLQGIIPHIQGVVAPERSGRESAPTPAVGHSAPAPSGSGGVLADGDVLPPIFDGGQVSTAPPSIPSLASLFPGVTTAPVLVFDPQFPRDVEVARKIIEVAMKAIGLPYQWGGGAIDGPTMGDGTGGSTPGFDCSGLVRWAVYQATGGRVELPRTSQVQFTAGTRVSMDQAQPGDLLFGNWQADGANHVAIYLGGGRMIEAPQTGQLVQISAVRSDMIPVRIA